MILNFRKYKFIFFQTKKFIDINIPNQKYLSHSASYLTTYLFVAGSFDIPFWFQTQLMYLIFSSAVQIGSNTLMIRREIQSSNLIL
jgi:hypothetical protein